MLKTIQGKAVAFLVFNVVLQGVPIWFLYRELHGQPKFEHIWDYVNCTLLFGLSFGMLLATISDSLTDQCHFSRRWRLLQLGAFLVGLSLLLYVIELEIVQGIKHNPVLLTLAAVPATVLIGLGTAIKIEIWGQHGGGGP
jgi:hypothetical protein